MSERDELVDIVYRGNYNNPASPFIQPLKDRSQDEIDRTFRTADAILAAGYRKPRTITTAEELDALAGGVLVLTEQGGYWESIKRSDGVNWWKEPGARNVSPSSSEDITLPATVLYEPPA